MIVKPEPKESIKFLRKWNPAAPWVLTSIQPDRKGIETRTFYPNQGKECFEWLERWNGKRNIYFHVNSVTHDLSKKATREEIKSVDWLHVDIDPRDGEDIEAERKRILELLLDRRPKGIPEPTTIIFSGGGYQAFWKLKESIPVNGDIKLAEDAKRYNQQLEILFEADNCHNIDRIMRLPGTINIPDERKKKKGRKPELASILQFTPDNVCDLGQFNPAQKEKSRSKGGTKVAITENVKRLISVDELDQWDVDGRVKVVIVQGNHPEQPKEGDNSRSAWLLDAVCSMIRSNVPDEVIFSIITDPEFGVSESVLEQTNPQEYASRQIQRGKDFAIDPQLYALNEKHAVVSNMGNKCRVIHFYYDEVMQRQFLAAQTFEDFKNAYLNKKVQCGETAGGQPKFVPVGKWWVEHEKRREYDRVVFAPNCSLQPNVLNLWQGFAVEIKKGVWEHFKQHILEVICCGDVELFNYLIRWLAFAVQYPDRQAEVAVVLKGGKGTGKGMFANAICKIFGQHSMIVSSPEHLAGNFNAHLADSCLLFADEAFWPGMKKLEGTLKSLITEPYLAIERKGVDVAQARNYLHIIMASNENWIVPASMDERRFAVFELSNKHQQDKQYFAAIANEIKNGGVSAMLYDLLNMDIKDWHPRDNIPQTKALLEQKIAGLNDVQRAVFECLVGGELDYDRMDGEYYHLPTRRFTQYIQSGARQKITEHAVGLFLGKRGINFIKQDKSSPKGYLIPELPEARAMWDKAIFPHEWDDSDKWHQVIVEPSF